MKKVLFISGQGQIVTDIFTGLAPEGFTVACKPDTASDAEKLEWLRDVEYLVLHPATLSGTLLREAKNLKLVQLLTAGYDKVDIHAAAACGIPVATNGGANAWAVAEHAIALLLALCKRLVECDASVRAGTWRKPVNGFNTFELAGKTVGVIGAGNIGRKVAARLKAFETDILYYDQVSVPEIETGLGAKKASLEEIAATSDVITLHAPLLESTRGLLGAKEFALMQPGAVLINTSRAELVDTAALCDALATGKIAGAGLDVFDTEPVPADSPLLSLANVILTPHTAGHSYEGWARRSRNAWGNIVRTANGEKAEFTVRV